jgi:uncharacterized membrane protein YkvI
LKEEFRNIVKVASVYMATIIGAGFASGQEIVRFFTHYYKGGFYGILVAGILFAVMGCIVLNKVYCERIRNYDEFLFPTVGWFLGWIMEITVTLFMISLFCVMIAGMGNILLEKFNLPFQYGIVAMALLCMAVILTDMKGIVSVSAFVTPLLTLGITAIGLYIVLFNDTLAFNPVGLLYKTTDNWLFSALIYVSYNSIMSVVVLCTLLPYLKTKRTGIVGGLLGGGLLCLIALILNTAILIFAPGSLLKELPVLFIVQKYGNAASNIYTFLLWLAMFLSAVTSGYCVVDRVGSKVSVNPKLLAVIICALVLPLSSFGFSNLIAGIYPVFGYIGLFMVFVVLFQGIKSISPRRLKKHFASHHNFKF